MIILRVMEGRAVSSETRSETLPFQNYPPLRSMASVSCTSGG